MEQSNNLDTVKLKKVVEAVFAGGEKAVEEFDYEAYTDEELEYIMKEMEEQTKKDVEELLKLVKECEKEENEAPEKNN
jgi:hypothetical protein